MAIQEANCMKCGAALRGKAWAVFQKAGKALCGVSKCTADIMPVRIKGDVLNLIYQADIFKVEHRPDGRFDVSELCDNYFALSLTGDELIKLGQELIRAANLPFPTEGEHE